MLDKIIEEAIATGKPIEFKRDDLDERRFRVLGGTSIEIEKEINRLSDMGYIPIGGLSCTYTSHGLVYAQLMENLYYNPMVNETQMDSKGSGQTNLGGADGEGGVSGDGTSETPSSGYDGQATGELPSG